MTIQTFNAVRFIPTYMGNARLTLQAWQNPTVHPHVHGERATTYSITTTPDGSSPRTWGTRGIRQRPYLAGRFIPTYMGNAHHMTLHILPLSVHPHVHGERRTVDAILSPRGGSSPRTWGTHILLPGERLPDRFIPTYMGNARYCRR